MNFVLSVLIFGVVLCFAKDDCIVDDFGKLNNAIQTCSEITIKNLSVPANQTLSLQLQDGTRVVFEGTTTFEFSNWVGPLVAINGTNITIEGADGSLLNGQGELYWDGQGEWGSVKPKFFIIQLHESKMKNIKIKNSPVHCVLLTDSSNVELSGWTVDNRDGDQDNQKENYGHNTDGFDVYNSVNITLKDSSVYNQDDCVAVRSGDHIKIDNFYCHGGHGLSISVGFSKDSVELNTLTNVAFTNSVLEKGENGIHIKTHVDAGEGLINNILYQNITITNVLKYGINIQQNYKNLPANDSFPAEPSNNIPITNLYLHHIHGSVEDSAVPIYILCGDDGCSDWMFVDVDVKGSQTDSCNYVPDGFQCS